MESVRGGLYPELTRNLTICVHFENTNDASCCEGSYKCSFKAICLFLIESLTHKIIIHGVMKKS